MRRTILALAAAAGMASFAHAQTTPAPAPAAPAPATAPATAPAATATTSEVFVVANPTDVLSSNVVGLNIHNKQDESIGEIKDVVISDGALTGYIVSVGGFLGLGERYVVVSPASVDIVYTEADKKWAARMDTTKDALSNAPEFKYEGRWAM